MLSLSKNTERLWSSPVSSIMYGHGWTPLSSTVQGQYVDILVMMFKANQYNELFNSKQALFNLFAATSSFHRKAQSGPERQQHFHGKQGQNIQNKKGQILINIIAAILVFITYQAQTKYECFGTLLKCTEKAYLQL